MPSQTEWRVRYYETDKLGVVYHSHYFGWFEVGRAEALRGYDSSYKAWEEAGIHLPLLECSCQYKAPARYDDVLIIETTLTRITRTRIAFAYRITNADTGQLLATGTTEHVFMNDQGKPTRIDGYPQLKTAMERMWLADSAARDALLPAAE